jgi:hypothetical protein
MKNRETIISYSFNRRGFLLAFLVPWIVLPVVLHGQSSENFPPPETPISIKAMKTRGKVMVDGKLNEAD